MQYLYKEIKQVDQSGITMSDGFRISFGECNRTWKDMNDLEGSQCVGTRDITAESPYFRFYGKDAVAEILFDGKGFIKKWQAAKRFEKLQQQICRYGYSTYDMS